MSVLWIHEIADRFWIDAGGAPERFPRDLLDVLCWAVMVTPEALPNLSIAAVNAWLAEHRFAPRLQIPDRPLRACILVEEGHGVLFFDAADPDDERRFSVAHETAHYLVECAVPRRRARARLGEGVMPVLEGWRAASLDERIGALLAGVSLGKRVHLMERTPDGHLPGLEVSVAERQADALALELLAPFDAVRACLPDPANRSAVEAILRQTFGLPAVPSLAYASRLVPDPPAGSLFRRLFSVS